jgi:hypothetical protein
MAPGLPIRLLDTSNHVSVRFSVSACAPAAPMWQALASNERMVLLRASACAPRTPIPLLLTSNVVMVPFCASENHIGVTGIQTLAQNGTITTLDVSGPRAHPALAAGQIAGSRRGEEDAGCHCGGRLEGGPQHERSCCLGGASRGLSPSEMGAGTAREVTRSRAGPTSVPQAGRFQSKRCKRTDSVSMTIGTHRNTNHVSACTYI